MDDPLATIVNPFAASPRGDKDGVFRRYIESMGYTYSWDFSRKHGEVWHEVLEDGKLVCQIPDNVRIESLRADCIAWNDGKEEGCSDQDYTLYIDGNSPAAKRFFKKVTETEPILLP